MSAHIPDISTPHGFATIVNAGNVIELAVALDRRTYTGVQAEDREEREPAMSKYRFFMRWFNDTFVTILNGHWVSATYLFWRSLVEFACTLLHYKEKEYEHEKAEETFHPDVLKAQLRQHFRYNWPELLPVFDKGLEFEQQWLSLDYTDVVFKRRSPEVLQQLSEGGLVELAYMPCCTLFNDEPKMCSHDNSSPHSPSRTINNLPPKRPRGQSSPGTPGSISHSPKRLRTMDMEM
jgi:hypothetical protein